MKQKWEQVFALAKHKREAAAAAINRAWAAIRQAICVVAFSRWKVVIRITSWLD
jgi:hypothetical protein